MHGAGGSAGVGILLVAGMDGDAAGRRGAAALRGRDGRSPWRSSRRRGAGCWSSHAVERRLSLLAPAFGTLSLLFGCWYGAMAALG